jgi:hypothetical protein
MYGKDAEGCAEDLAFWKKHEKAEEETIRELARLIKSNIDLGRG